MKTGKEIVVSVRAGEGDVSLSAYACVTALYIAVDMTADEARELAAELIAAANLAEGGKA